MKHDRNKYLEQLPAHLIKENGEEKAGAIMRSAVRHYDALCLENADEPKAYDMHTKQRIYPAVAAFRAMTESGIPRQEAIDFLCGYYRWRSRNTAAMIGKLLKVPGLYRLMPGLFRKMTPRMFGESAGFKAVWHEDKEWPLRFDMVRCPYKEKCMAYGCPELCEAYCDADDICYGNMHPRLVWGRTKTLGKGGDCCDFKMTILLSPINTRQYGEMLS